MKLRNLLLLLGATATIGAQAEHLKSLDPKGIDPNTPASEDFYQHVNKGWMDSHPLTPEYSRYGAFNILNDSSNNRVKRIVTGLAATNPQPEQMHIRSPHSTNREWTLYAATNSELNQSSLT